MHLEVTIFRLETAHHGPGRGNFWWKKWKDDERKKIRETEGLYTSKLGART
jgi:hypothetical protein